MPPWKIIPLIRSLHQNQEVEAFRLWMEEKSRIPDNYVLALFDALVQVIAEGREAELSGASCWTLIRPQDPYDKNKSDNQLRQYRSELKDKIDRFILERALDQEDNDQVRLLYFQALSDRKLHGLLEKDYRQQLGKWENKDVLDLNDLHFLFEVEQMRNLQKVQETRVKTTHLPNVIERFLEYSLATYLKLACINLSENAVLAQDYQPAYLQELLAMLTGREVQPEEGLLFVYYHLYRFLDGQSNEVDHILHALRPENTTLRAGERKDIYGLIQNGISRRMNLGGFSRWAPKMLELFQWGLDNQSVLENDQIDPRNYRNIIITALRLDRRQEAWDLIEELRPYLPPEAGEYYRFCKGYFHYTVKAYDEMKTPEAWDPTQPFANTILRISSDLISLQADYERYWGTGEEEEVYLIKERIQTLKRFIKAQKTIGEANKASWLLRLSYFKKMLRKLDRKRLEALYEEIQNAPLLANRAWFLYQIKWRLDLME
jgi:hypothetical protein